MFTAGTHLNYDTPAERLQEIAFLNSGLRIVLKDERSGNGEEFFYEGGASQFVQFLNEGKDVLHDVIHFYAEKDDIEVEIALQYNADIPKRWLLSLTPSRRAGWYA